jgi:dethiobiotin synthetase
LIEGAGGLCVPVEKNFFMYDFIKFFDAKALLVTHSKLGCINDTLLNLELLKALHVEHEWCINMRDEESFEKTTLPYYKDRFGRVLTLQNDLREIASSLH